MMNKVSQREIEDIEPEPWNWLCRFKIHKWCKWGPLDVGYRSPSVDGNLRIEAQLRVCTKCGEWQVKKRVTRIS
jgi:hypothetical protein